MDAERRDASASTSASRVQLRACAASPKCPDFSQWRSRSGAVTGIAYDRNFSVKLTSNAAWQATRGSTSRRPSAPTTRIRKTKHRASAARSFRRAASQSVQAAVTTVSTATRFRRPTRRSATTLQEQATLRDRLFVTVAVRTDQNSAFGTKFERASRIRRRACRGSRRRSRSSRSFGWLNQFRVRARVRRVGRSAAAPPIALVTYTAPIVNVNSVDTPGLARSVARQSDPQAGARRRSSRAASIRAALDNRVNLELTYYSKKTNDALLDRSDRAVGRRVGRRPCAATSRR